MDFLTLSQSAPSSASADNTSYPHNYRPQAAPGIMSNPQDFDSEESRRMVAIVGNYSHDFDEEDLFSFNAIAATPPPYFHGNLPDSSHRSDGLTPLDPPTVSNYPRRPPRPSLTISNNKLNNQGWQPDFDNYRTSFPSAIGQSPGTGGSSSTSEYNSSYGGSPSITPDHASPQEVCSSRYTL